MFTYSSSAGAGGSAQDSGANSNNSNNSNNDLPGSGVPQRRTGRGKKRPRVRVVAGITDTEPEATTTASLRSRAQSMSPLPARIQPQQQADEVVMVDATPPPAPASPRTAAACRRIQRAWTGVFRWRTTARLLMRHFRPSNISPNHYLGGPTRAWAASIGFEALCIALRDKRLVAIAKATLQRIHILCFNCNSTSLDFLAEEVPTVNVRVFLAAYMIACRPTHVFESMGKLEQALFEISAAVLAQLEQICEALLSQPSHRTGPGELPSAAARPAAQFSQILACLTTPLVSMLFEFLRRFKAWKVPDEAKLTARIQHALVALYTAQKELPPDEPKESSLQRELVTQITRLREKLVQIAGAEQLLRFDQQRATRIGYQPEQSCGSLITDDEEQRLSGAMVQSQQYYGNQGPHLRLGNEVLAHELLLDSTFQLTDDGDLAPNGVAQRIRESFHRCFWDSLADDLCLAAGPCYVRVLRVLREIRDGLLDLNGPREAIEEVIDIGFIETRVEAGTYTWASVCGLVMAVYAIVRGMRSARRDTEHNEEWRVVRAQMQEDDATFLVEEGQGHRSRRQANLFCKAVEFLLQCVSHLRIDAANARLRLIAPVIDAHGVDYERGKFSARMESGELTLERTRMFIRRSVRAEMALPPSRLLRLLLPPTAPAAATTTTTTTTTTTVGFLDELLSGTASAFVRVHTAMLLHLIVAPNAELHAFAVDATTSGVPAQGNGLLGVVPETLLYDVRRIEYFRHQFNFQVQAVVHLVAAELMLPAARSVVVVGRAAGGSPLLPAPPPPPPLGAAVGARVLLDLQAALGAWFADSDNISVREGVTRAVEDAQAELLLRPDGTSPTDPEAAKRLKAFLDMVAKSADPTNSVTQLLRARVASTWRFLMLHGGEFPTRENAPELTAMYGAARVLQPRIIETVTRLMHLARINRAVHATHYSVLIHREAAAAAATAATPSPEASPSATHSPMDQDA